MIYKFTVPSFVMNISHKKMKRSHNTEHITNHDTIIHSKKQKHNTSDLPCLLILGDNNPTLYELLRQQMRQSFIPCYTYRVEKTCMDLSSRDEVASVCGSYENQVVFFGERVVTIRSLSGTNEKVFFCENTCHVHLNWLFYSNKGLIVKEDLKSCTQCWSVEIPNGTHMTYQSTWNQLIVFNEEKHGTSILTLNAYNGLILKQIPIVSCAEFVDKYFVQLSTYGDKMYLIEKSVEYFESYVYDYCSSDDEDIKEYSMTFEPSNEVATQLSIYNREGILERTIEIECNSKYLINAHVIDRKVLILNNDRFFHMDSGKLLTTITSDPQLPQFISNTQAIYDGKLCDVVIDVSQMVCPFDKIECEHLRRLDFSTSCVICPPGFDTYTSLIGSMWRNYHYYSLRNFIFRWEVNFCRDRVNLDEKGLLSVKNTRTAIERKSYRHRSTFMTVLFFLQNLTKENRPLDE